MSAVASTAGRILVIDDEFGPRESLRFLFKDEYDVICKDSVDEGIAELRKTPPDVVILDIKMPGKNGIEGLGEIREVDPFVSVIMLTGFGNLDTAQKAIRLGANDYIRKPFDTREMRETVRKYVDRTRVARKRADTTRELEELNQTLKHDLVSARHYASLGEASTEFVHDLRNPLTVISGYVQLLLSDMRAAKESGEQQTGEALDYLNLIDRNVTRCYEMSEMWRSLGRRDELVMSPFPLDELLRDIVHDAEHLAAPRGVDIRLAGTPGELQVECDAVQLSRAIQNLVSNALEAVPDGQGRIEIAWTRDSDKVVLSVRDNGPGIPPSRLDRLFDVQETTKAASGGLGVGLFISRKAVAMHGGDLKIANRDEGGVEATVHLPVRQATD